jgi:DNA-binding CsgD family transcriptional regulator
MVRSVGVPYRRIRECFPAYAGRRPVSDEPAAVPAVPSGRASQLAAALSVLELGDCERELLVRATATGSAATIPSQGAEWDAKELTEAADALAHDGFVTRHSNGVLAAADDLLIPTVERARREASKAVDSLVEKAKAVHAGILSRCKLPPQSMRRSADQEADFRALLDGHRLVVNVFPSFLPDHRDFTYFNAPALESTRRESGSRIERDVVSSRRLSLPTQIDFFAAHTSVASASVTVARDVPLRLTLIDGNRAVVPIDPLDHVAGGWVIDDESAVAQVGLHVAEQMATSEPWHAALRLYVTDREVQVIRLLAAGLTDEGIARRLHITDRTVRRIVAELMAKLGVDSRFALAVECARHALV